jgi:hypothetical protein
VIINYQEIEGSEYGLPPWVMTKLEGCPAGGEGVHNWLWHIALALRHYVEIDEGVEIARVFMTRGENPAGEVINTFENAYATEYHGLPYEAYGEEEYEPNPEAVERIYRSYKLSPLTLLKSVSHPIPDLPTIIDRLYFKRDFVCYGNAFYNKKGEKQGYNAITLLQVNLVTGYAMETLYEYAQIVPNPMTAEEGCTKGGKTSARSIENAAVHRRYAVTDFDFTVEGAFGGVIQRLMFENGLMPREMIHEITAALILEIAQRSPDITLIMVVDSGGKSLHAWWDIRHMTFEQQRKWFFQWVPLGADPAIFKSNNQFVRMPHGTREVHGHRQPVIYWGL